MEWTNNSKYTNSKDLTGWSRKQKAILEYLILDYYKESAARSSNYIPQELNPVQDQRGFIRHGTRLDKSELPTFTKYPIILMRDHKLTELIFRDLHIQNKHIGTEHLVVKKEKSIGSQNAGNWPDRSKRQFKKGWSRTKKKISHCGNS
uniref:Uncharacterized protein n=1 Tax=Caenorhabditis japonica TaxID=281687 RepID=A0A8R1I3Y1_CAEJA